MEYRRQIIALMAMILLTNTLTAADSKPSYYTTDILRLAKGFEIKAFLQENQPPCQNFYKFACGRWVQSNPAPSGGKSSNLDQRVELSYIRRCAAMLASDRCKSDWKVFNQLKDFYASCLNTAILDENGLKDIVFMAEFTAGWPVVNNFQWYQKYFDWLSVVATMRRKMDVDILIRLQIGDPYWNSILLGAPKFYLDRDSYLQEDKESIRLAYVASIENQLRRYFPKMPEKWAGEVAQQVLAVEKRLAEGLPPPNNDMNKTRSIPRELYPYEFETFKDRKLDIKNYLFSVFVKIINGPVYLEDEHYLFTLAEVMNSTPTLTIANYTMWKILEKFDLPRAKVAKDSQYCVNQLREYLPDALNIMFLNTYPINEMIDELQSVWKDIKQTFHSELENSQHLAWMEAVIKQNALERLESMELRILNETEMNDRHLGKIEISRTHYHQNLVRLWNYKNAFYLDQVRERVREHRTAHTLPKYDYVRNKINIPVEFLQTHTLWEAAYPQAILYSTLGYLLAQQMLKGIVSYLGNWDDSSRNKYTERAELFFQQYWEYKFPKWAQKKNTELMDNYVADNGALNIAYKAYQQWSRNSGNSDLEEKEKVSLLSLQEYNPNQLFFITFAQTWCADYSEDIAEFNETPEMWRVNGALANSIEFAQEFQCDLGADMNPEEKRILY
ncbi:neprilysin-4-like [Musca vetustissima]|uniref:neprilysin-4-like n=1 Tax=Musca vetustissima TaxID=27455 RepID=UPI002AB74C42|nr:neprilysin-4-like [Musca vetustissima]